MNHRFLLRLITNLAVFLLGLSCLGIVLWVIDEFLGWDILPEAWSLAVRAFLVAGGIISFVLVVMNVLLSLALLAESSASRAELPNYGISQRLKRRVRNSIVAGILAIALLIAGLQVTDHLRARAAAQTAEAEFIQAQAEMNESMAAILPLFTPTLLEGLETNTLAEQGQLGNTIKLLESIQTSFPNAPSLSLVVPAQQAPLKYAQITRNSFQSNSGRVVLSPQFYAAFPSQQEAQMIEQLFAGELPAVTEPLTGSIIDNTVPSSWGVLRRNNNIIAVAYLQGGFSPEFGRYSPRQYSRRDYSDQYHTGPDALLSN